ncbi:hypothetical protein EW146_g4396 [Bondarzewia mesenterica]|uniref:Xylanolytic transcriptional activator regulatory domain-containing protein n=1 Tax=Bondarzewia mesenterica TaxID=1095465 RepID=A0A4S4LV75_9AGAM|nr:hypothetical protein EW146_g4396 [Bondarzewia mesenterica]
MHHLESLIQAIPPAVFAAGGPSAFADMPQTPLDGQNSHSGLGPQDHVYPSAVPPPSLNIFPLMNPSTHFKPSPTVPSRHSSPTVTFGAQNGEAMSVDQFVDDTARMSLSSSYLYLDDEGYTRWQGETSGLPILDLLVERHRPAPQLEHREPSPQQDSRDWFPDRIPKRTDIHPEKIWKLITSFIAPDLMDSLVQCYLSTSYYLMPFLHVPTFLNDYGNPQKWGEPGFASFIVAVCCLASRHIDDPRVRADPADGISSGTQWIELFGRLRTLPAADRPTVYTVQAVLIAGVYTVGWGKLSKAFALLSESITLSIDAGLHRSADAYDIFDPIEEEVRKRTFWCVYMWDKQASAHFGRPPMIRLRDCDVGEPNAVDDEFITHEGVGPQPPDTESRMGAFVCVVRLFVVLESVLDSPPPKFFGDSSPFLNRATSILVGFRRHKGLREEEMLLDEVCNAIPSHWRHSPETMASEDVIQVTHAKRLHCLELFIRMLIMRHRFSELVAERTATGEQEQGEVECEAMTVAHSCALQIVSAHLHIATKGLMTYYGVHVIHQLTQAGRTLVAFLLNCQSDSLRPLITPALDALRSCVGLLRRFSNRYICGLRSGDLMEEFCRITQIPLDPPSVSADFPQSSKTLPPWIRPVRKKTPSAPRSTDSQESPPHDAGEPFSPTDMFVELSSLSKPPSNHGGSIKSPTVPHANYRSPNVGMPPANQASPSQFPSTIVPPHFIDTAGSSGLDSLIKSDAALAMSPAEIMALFQDGNMDMASLFPLQPDFLGEGSTTTDTALYGQSFASGKQGNGSAGDLSGLVASP